MKVLIIPSWYPEGDDKLMGIYHKEYTHALSKTNVEVDMLCVFRERLKYPIRFIVKKKNSIYQENGYKVYIRRILDLEKINIKLHMSIYYRSLERLFKKYIKTNGKPDILHAQVTYPAGYATAKLGKKYNIPVLVTEHASHFTQYFENKYAPYGNYVLENTYFSTVSNLMKKQLNKKDTYILPNIVDTSIFCVRKHKKHKTIKLMTIAAFRTGKGIEYLIEALSILINKYNIKDIHLDIIGDGYLMNFYKEKVKEFTLESHITFHGRKTKEEISMILSSGDIYVIPSNYESFCITGVEALACGLPVVSTRCYGPEEYIDSKCGEFCEIKNPESMAKAILKVSENLEKYEPEYLASVANKYSYDAVTKKALEIYNKIIKSSKN